MIKGKKVLCIISARLGSKGILNKNIKLFNKKPLIYWTIYEAIKSKYIDRCIVSTDSQKIKKISTKFGAEVPFLRPKSISKDSSEVTEAILYTINNIREKYDLIILLQPTSPLRKVRDVDKAIELMIKNNSSSLVSITKLKYPVEWILNKNNKNNVKFLSNKYIFQRQKSKLFFKPNGSIFLSTIKNFIKHKSFYIKNTYGYEMSDTKSIDIDNEFDFNIAEYLFKNNYC